MTTAFRDIISLISGSSSLVSRHSLSPERAAELVMETISGYPQHLNYLPILLQAHGELDVARAMVEKKNVEYSDVYQNVKIGDHKYLLPHINNIEEGAGLLTLVAAVNRNSGEAIKVLDKLSPLINQWSEEKKQKELSEAAVYFMKNCVDLKTNPIENRINFIKKLGEFGLKFQDKSQAKKAAEGCAYQASSFTASYAAKYIPLEIGIQGAIDLMDTLKNMGVGKNELAAYCHSFIIRHDYTRYSKSSPLPQASLGFIKAGYALTEAQDMSYPYNPTATALSLGLVRAMPHLLSSGANLNWQDDRTGLTLLMLCADGKKSTLTALDMIPEGLFNDSVNLVSTGGETALHAAVSRMSAPMVERIFKEGADPSIKNKKGKTPFQLLNNARGAKAQENYEKIVEIFAQNGVELTEKEDALDPLHSAARSLSLATVQKLISEGLDIRAKDKNKETPVEICITGQPPLKAVARMTESCSKQFEIITEFMKAGLDINEQLKQGKTMLHLAVQERRWPLVTMLMKSGANPNQTDENGVLPFARFSDSKISYQNYDWLVGKFRREIIALIPLIDEAGGDIYPDSQGKDPFEILLSDPETKKAIVSLREMRLLLNNTAEVKTVRKEKSLRL